MDLYKELLSLVGELKEYKKFLDTRDSELSEKHDELREKLARRIGGLKDKIVHLTNRQLVTQFYRTYDIWDTAVSSTAPLPSQKTALKLCIDAINEAIGKLEKEGKSWEVEVDKVRKLKAAKSSYQQIWAWIKSHKIISIIFSVVIFTAAVVTIIRGILG